jgi:hypothetical protein
MIPHLQEHLFHVGKPKQFVPGPAVLVERLELSGCNFILLEGVRRGEERAHVLDKR